MGRGGRIILDRAHHDLDDFWRTVDFTIYEPNVVTNLSDAKHNNSGGDFGQCDDRLRTNSVSLFSGGVIVKSEPIEIKEELHQQQEEEEQRMVVDAGFSVKEEEESDVMEFLKTVRKEW